MNIPGFLRLVKHRHKVVDGKKVIVYKVDLQELDEYINDLYRLEDDGGPTK